MVSRQFTWKLVSSISLSFMEHGLQPEFDLIDRRLSAWGLKAEHLAS